MIIYCLQGCFDKGIHVVLGPVLVIIFGLKMGSILYPINLVTFYILLAILPPLQDLLFMFITWDHIFFVFGGLIGIGFFWGMSLMERY